MLRLGLTGGIASGKSTVGAMLRDLGFTVLDADSIAHRLIAPGTPANEEILREFGTSIANGEKTIDRAALAKIVFADAKKLSTLNAIVHPRVEAHILSEFAELQRDSSRKAAFVEAALIVEAGLDKVLDGLLVAWCKPEQQIARLVARGFTEEDARRRIAAQLPIEEKLRRATERIDCSGSLAETQRQVQQLADKIVSQSETRS
ncbi:MAG: dephospho-CoA kinase [Acidobacteriota bacterium]|nr:dephospho-CoA kinase [Acidobacteriota bacterium]